MRLLRLFKTLGSIGGLAAWGLLALALIQWLSKKPDTAVDFGTPVMISYSQSPATGRSLVVSFPVSITNKGDAPDTIRTLAARFDPSFFDPPIASELHLFENDIHGRELHLVGLNGNDHRDNIMCQIVFKPQQTPSYAKACGSEPCTQRLEFTFGNKQNKKAIVNHFCLVLNESLVDEMMRTGILNFSNLDSCEPMNNSTARVNN